MDFTPVPAIFGLNADEVTPGPDQLPPSGTPPFSVMRVVFKYVAVSKHFVRETRGKGLTVIGLR